MSERRDDTPISAEVSGALSAAQDGELDAETQAKLSAQAEVNPNVARQAAAFEAVDDALRELASPIPESELARMLGEFEDRVPEEMSMTWRERPFVWAAIAAAAVLLLAILAGRQLGPASLGDFEALPDFAGAGDPRTDTIDDPEDRRALSGEALGDDPLNLEADLEAEWVWAIGTLAAGDAGEVVEDMLGISADELEMIEELEILEYLAARDPGGRG